MMAKSHSNLGSNTVSVGTYRSGSGRPVPQGTLEANKPVMATFIGHGLDPDQIGLARERHRGILHIFLVRYVFLVLGARTKKRIFGRVPDFGPQSSRNRGVVIVTRAVALAVPLRAKYGIRAEHWVQWLTIHGG